MSKSYPEHLNPFAEDFRPKRRGSIRESFKDFRRSLRQSFRIKKKDHDEVIIRQKPDTPQKRLVLYYSQQGEALPRSRFRERLSKGDQHRDDRISNPFEEVEDNDDSKETTIKRRAKKRAPLPPKSRSSQHLNEENLEIPATASHWSLTSVETEYSSMARDDNRDEGTQTRRESIAEEFVEFNKNMDGLQDDTNNNVITKEECSHEKEEEEEKEEEGEGGKKPNNNNNSNIPDLVVSCPSAVDTKIPTKNVNEETSSVKSNEDSIIDISEDQTDLIVKDITNNMILDDSNRNHEIQVDQSSKDKSFLYIEQKSLDITNSKEELNNTNTYEGKISLYITGSGDNLDSSNNNEIPKDVNDEDCNDDTIPTPKQRKNKLTKDVLLGM